MPAVAKTSDRPRRGGRAGTDPVDGEDELSEKSTAQTIATVERAADVLRFFTTTDLPTLGVTEIANELSLSKAAVHRILASLRGRGFVELDGPTRRYHLGPAALALGLAYLNRVDVRMFASAELRELARTTRETATLSVRAGDQRIYLDQVLPQREITMSVPIGVAYPMHAGASSKAFLAFLPDEEIDRYLERPLNSVTDKTIVDPKALRSELSKIHRKGYAMSLGERQAGAASVAAPVFDHNGQPVAVLSVCGPIERFKAEVPDVVPVLLDATARISARMGWTRPDAD